MDFGFKVTSQAKRDLNRIWQYIAKEDVQTADRFCNKLYAIAESLQNFPQRHGNLSQRPNIRKVAYGSYLIFYKIDERNQTVEILRFWHASRNQNRLCLREETPEYGASLNELELRRHQLASGEGAVIPGDEILLQQSQAQQ